MTNSSPKRRKQNTSHRKSSRNQGDISLMDMAHSKSGSRENESTLSLLMDHIHYTSIKKIQKLPLEEQQVLCESMRSSGLTAASVLVDEYLEFMLRPIVEESLLNKN